MRARAQPKQTNLGTMFAFTVAGAMTVL